MRSPDLKQTANTLGGLVHRPGVGKADNTPSAKLADLSDGLEMIRCRSQFCLNRFRILHSNDTVISRN